MVKVLAVSTQQRRVVGQTDTGDLEIHRPNTCFRPLQRFECLGGIIVPVQNSPGGEKAKELFGACHRR